MKIISTIVEEIELLLMEPQKSFMGFVMIKNIVIFHQQDVSEITGTVEVGDKELFGYPKIVP